MKQTKKEIKIDLWDYYDKLQLAVQRFILIKKVLGIKVGDFHTELDWVLRTFNNLNKESETSSSCGYMTIKTYKEGEKQKIEFFFNMA